MRFRSGGAQTEELADDGAGRDDVDAGKDVRARAAGLTSSIFVEDKNIMR